MHLLRIFRPLLLTTLLLSASAFAQQTDAQLATSETLFTTMAALNSCGYDQELASSDPIRAQVRTELDATLESRSAAKAARDQFCAFYRDKQTGDSSRTLAQFVSLALNLSEPPTLALRVKEADLPPDASEVLGALPLLQRLYSEAAIRTLWRKFRPEYEARIAELQQPVSSLLQRTDLYLRDPSSNFLGRRFIIFIEPQGPPGQVNARNYGADYYLVISPNHATGLRAQEVRHTYLHYILDPMIQRRANTVAKLAPLLELARTAPIDESYKEDPALMVTESLIRAIEARQIPGPRDSSTEQQRAAAADASENEGFLLTSYFYERLVTFEKEPTSFRDALPDMLAAIDLPREKKRAANIVFTRNAASDPLHSASGNAANSNLLDTAEQRLAANDPQGAHRLAQQALDEQAGDPARAMFILARAATLNRDIDGAQIMFERTIEVAHDPHLIAWSHIYLGRILDLQCSRDAALAQYKLAASAGDLAPETKAAIERGTAQAPDRCAEKE